MAEPSHLLELIEQVRPQAALLTTYTFSPSFFDAVMLPALLTAGCRDITVLVDATQAALSAQASLSVAAGRAYRIAPVLAPGAGVFHAKLAYLVTPSADVLAVGSGNLTASGQLTQLETFDAVSAGRWPSVFFEFGAWAQHLSQLVSRTSPQASRSLLEASKRAQRTHERFRAEQDLSVLAPTLVQTLRVPAAISMATEFKKLSNRATDIVCLSPFHAPDGGPLVELADSVRATRVRVGLSSACPEVTPVMPRPSKGLRFDFVLPTEVGVEKPRRLHAKVFELHAPDKVFVVTGSVNATHRSLNTCENVEVSLARWLTASPFQWQPASATHHEPNVYESASEQGLYVDAQLQPNGVLEGTLSSKSMGFDQGSAQLVLLLGSTPVWTGTVALANDGTFQAALSTSAELVGSLQLVVRLGECVGRAWVSMEAALEQSKTPTSVIPSVAKLLEGNANSSEMAAVLVTLCECVKALAVAAPDAESTPDELGGAFDAVTSGSRRNRQGDSRQPATPMHRVLRSLTAWVATARGPTLAALPDAGSPGACGLSAAPIGSGMASRKRESHPPTPGYLDSGVSGLLDQLCSDIAELLQKRPKLAHRQQLATLVAARAIQRCLYPGAGLAPATAWLTRFAAIQFDAQDRQPLGDVAIAMAAWVAERTSQSDCASLLPTLREAAERICGQRANEAWTSRCMSGLGSAVFAFLPEGHRTRVLQCCEQLRQAQSRQEALVRLLSKAQTEKRKSLMEEPEAMMFPSVAQQLRQRAAAKSELLAGLIDEARLALESGVGCPFCSQELSYPQRAQLRREGVLVHTGRPCHKLLMVDSKGELRARLVQELSNA